MFLRAFDDTTKVHNCCCWCSCISQRRSTTAAAAAVIAPSVDTYSAACGRKTITYGNEARGIRTPNLLIWSQTRCRCAIPPRRAVQRLGINLSLDGGLRSLIRPLKASYLCFNAGQVGQTRAREMGPPPPPPQAPAPLTPIRKCGAYLYNK